MLGPLAADASGIGQNPSRGLFLSRPPASVLLIATRQIGDVLLVTPLLRSIRRAWPDAHIDVLVYSDKGDMLEGNPDCNAVITSDEHPNLTGYRGLLAQVRRRYELAVTTQANDRGHIYAWLAAPHRAGIVPDLRFQSAWKRASCRAWTPLDNVHTHTVIQNLRLADIIGVPRIYEVVPPRTENLEKVDKCLPFNWRHEQYAVLHPFPMWNYKRWTEDGWLYLIQSLVDRGLRVVLTGGPGPEEAEFCRRLAIGLPHAVNSVAGMFSLAELTAVLEAALLFVGPDTSITHQAAACGTPTVAIYGPTNPVKWGPWPAGFGEDRSPFVNKALTQRIHNVLLVQPAGDCVPCHEEGCDRHKASYSRCLQLLSGETVTAAALSMLGKHRAGW